MKIERKYLSVVEAEQMTGLSRWFWRRHAYSGRIASSKCGSRLVLPLEEVERLIAEGMRARLKSVA
jgi:hypothetical protein